MYRKQVRRRRAVLVALIVVSLVLLSSHFSEAESGPLHTIQRGVGGNLRMDLEADHDLPLAGFALDAIVAHLTTTSRRGR